MDPAVIDGFGFYHPIDYVFRVARHLEAYGVYPEPGGYNDQDARLMDDLDTLALLRAWREDVLYPDRFGTPASPETFFANGKPFQFK